MRAVDCVPALNILTQQRGRLKQVRQLIFLPRRLLTKAFLTTILWEMYPHNYIVDSFLKEHKRLKHNTHNRDIILMLLAGLVFK